MSKKTCFMIFIVAVTVIMASFVLHFSPVTMPVSKIFYAMQNLYIALSAVIAALLLLKQKYYWLIMLGCGLFIVALIQMFLIGGAIISVAALYRVLAFLVYAYLVILARHML